MMKKISYSILGLFFFVACTKQDLTEKDHSISHGNSLIKESITFEAIGSIDLGSTGASEISAFDPLTNKLFVVKNDVTPGRIEVLDLSNPAIPAIIGNILISDYGSAVNSVSVNNGMLAAAIESNPKQNPGRIVVFRTTDYTVLANKEAGALPDMVTFSPDGKFIISANEGEPNDAYTIDPIGTVSFLDVDQNFALTTIDFSGFAGQEDLLKAKGLRKFGPNASFAQDMEPEYVAVSANSKTAWVSLQENNAIARIDIKSKTIEEILPLGFKNYSLSLNAIDPSDADGMIGNLSTW